MQITGGCWPPSPQYRALRIPPRALETWLGFLPPPTPAFWMPGQHSQVFSLGSSIPHGSAEMLEGRWQHCTQPGWCSGWIFLALQRLGTWQPRYRREKSNRHSQTWEELIRNITNNYFLCILTVLPLCPFVVV